MHGGVDSLEENNLVPSYRIPARRARLPCPRGTKGVRGRSRGLLLNQYRYELRLKRTRSAGAGQLVGCQGRLLRQIPSMLPRFFDNVRIRAPDRPCVVLTESESSGRTVLFVIILKKGSYNIEKLWQKAAVLLLNRGPGRGLCH